jgi:hypothetical protein
MDGLADGQDLTMTAFFCYRTQLVESWKFTSYKAPNLFTVEQRLADLMGDAASNPYRDVYDFCNRYSHGEGAESVDVLDSRVVYAQIRRCMEFLKFADPEHFKRLCKATGADPTTIA